MNATVTEQAATELRRAYLRRDPEKVEELSRKLTSLAAKEFSRHRPETLDRLINALGPVIQAADARGEEPPGTQWRRLSQIARLLRDYPQELEVQRWLDPKSVHGLLLRVIRNQPGITVTELAKRAGDRKLNHISNALSRLEKAGYVTGASSGRFRHLYLSPMAKKKLEQYEGALAELIHEHPVAGDSSDEAKVTDLVLIEATAGWGSTVGELHSVRLGPTRLTSAAKPALLASARGTYLAAQANIENDAKFNQGDVPNLAVAARLRLRSSDEALLPPVAEVFFNETAKGAEVLEILASAWTQKTIKSESKIARFYSSKSVSGVTVINCVAKAESAEPRSQKGGDFVSRVVVETVEVLRNKTPAPRRVVRVSKD